jgi:hypothetical protein
MIQLVMLHVVCALQGGIRMPSHSSSGESEVTPEQIWPALATDLRSTRVECGCGSSS